MQKVYYLLRENHESGPFTIDELLLQRLRNTDLVWVEGRTAAWCHPYELEELTVTYSVNPKGKTKEPPKPARPAPTVTTDSLKSKPRKEDLEKRAEQIRQQVLSSASARPAPHLRLEEDNSRSYYKLNEEEINLVYHSRRSRFRIGTHATAMASMMIFIAAAWFGRDVWLQRLDPSDGQAKPLVSGESIELSAAGNLRLKPAITEPAGIVTPAVDSLVAEGDSVTTATLPANTVVYKPQPTEKPAETKAVQVKEDEPAPVVKNEARTEKPEQPVVNEVKAKPEPAEKKEVKETEPVKEVKKEAAAEDSETENAQPKKKGLGKVIQGIFGKKKKSDD